MGGDSPPPLSTFDSCLTLQMTIFLYNVYFSAYVSSLPPPARPHLELQLDSDHDGVEMDLHQIAEHMLKWEEKLSAHLGLTPADIDNIKERNPFKPELQK